MLIRAVELFYRCSWPNLQSSSLRFAAYARNLGTILMSGLWFCRTDLRQKDLMEETLSKFREDGDSGACYCEFT